MFCCRVFSETKQCRFRPVRHFRPSVTFPLCIPLCTRRYYVLIVELCVCCVIHSGIGHPKFCLRSGNRCHVSNKQHDRCSGMPGLFYHTIIDKSDMISASTDHCRVDRDDTLNKLSSYVTHTNVYQGGGWYFTFPMLLMIGLRSTSYDICRVVCACARKSWMHRCETNEAQTTYTRVVNVKSMRHQDF